MPSNDIIRHLGLPARSGKRTIFGHWNQTYTCKTTVEAEPPPNRYPAVDQRPNRSRPRSLGPSSMHHLLTPSDIDSRFHLENMSTVGPSGESIHQRQGKGLDNGSNRTRSYTHLGSRHPLPTSGNQENGVSAKITSPSYRAGALRGVTHEEEHPPQQRLGRRQFSSSPARPSWMDKNPGIDAMRPPRASPMRILNEDRPQSLSSGRSSRYGCALTSVQESPSIQRINSNRSRFPSPAPPSVPRRPDARFSAVQTAGIYRGPIVNRKANETPQRQYNVMMNNTPIRGLSPASSSLPEKATAHLLSEYDIEMIEDVKDQGLRTIVEWLMENVSSNDEIRSSQPMTPESAIDVFLAAKSWVDQLRGLDHLEHALDRTIDVEGLPAPPCEIRWSRTITTRLIEALKTCAESPRSKLSRNTLIVIFKLFIVRANAFQYSPSYVEVLPSICLKRAQKHIHPDFIVDAGRLAFIAWATLAPLRDVVSGLDKILGTTKVVHQELALSGCLISLLRHRSSDVDVWSTARSLSMGLRTIVDRGKRSERQMAALILFFILIVFPSRDSGKSPTSHFRVPQPSPGRMRSAGMSPARPRAATPPYVLALAKDLSDTMSHVDAAVLKLVS